MSDTSPSYIRGFLVPYALSSANYWANQSTITQQGIEAGSVEPQQVSGLGLITSGSQGPKSVTVRTHRAGQINDGPELIWREEGDSDWYGRDGAGSMSRWELLIDNGGGSTDIIPRDILGLDDGTVMVSLDRQESVNGLAQVATISTTGVVSTTTLYTSPTGTLSNAQNLSSLCAMPDGSVTCFVLVSDTNDNKSQVYAYRSTDDGATWSLMAQDVLPATIDVSGSYGVGTAVSIKRIVARANQSQVLMCLELESHNSGLTSAHIIAQYASISQGSKFTAVYQSTGSDTYYQIGLTQYNGYYVLTYASAHNSYASLLVSNAYESIGTSRAYFGGNVITTNTLATVSGNRLQNGNISSWLDEDGQMYVAYRAIALNYRINVSSSTLLGQAGADIGKIWYGVGQVYDSDDSSSTVSNFVAGAAQGRQLICHNMNPSGTNNFDGSLCAMWVGGYSNVTQPKNNSFALPYEYSGFTEDWIPIDLPQTTVWTANGSGAEALAAGYLQITTTTTTHTRDYNQGISDKTSGVTILARCEPVSGGSRTLGNGIEVRMEPSGSSATSMWVRIGIGVDGISIYDVHTGSVIAQDASLVTSGGVEVIVAVNNNDGRVVLWYKTNELGAKRYSKLSGTLSSSGAATGNVIKWGLVGTNGTNQVVKWHHLSFAQGSAVGMSLIDFVNPADLNGRPYPPQSHFAYIDEGLNVSTYDGPARQDDEYKIEPYYSHGVSRMLYAVSPSNEVRWRSEAVANPDTTAVASQRVAWALDEGNLGTVNGHLGNELMGVHMSGINFRSFSIQKYTAGVGWSTVHTYDNSISFSFTRKGREIISSAVSGPYLHLNECKNWWIQLTLGGTTVLRRIESNTEGILASGSAIKSWVGKITKSNGSEPTTGTAYLIPDSCTCVMDLAGNVEASAWAVNITAQQTADGDFAIGNLMIGPVVIPTLQYSRGRSILLQSGVERTIQRDGVVRASRAGNDGRQIQIQWAEGIDISDLNDATATPNYWTSTTTGGAKPIAISGNAPTLMMGLLSRLGGPTNPVVYLPSITRSDGSTDNRIYNRYHHHMMGVMMDDITIDSVLGEELQGGKSGEVFRVANITLREVR